MQFPLQIQAPEDFSRYGESYYDQMTRAEDWEPHIRDHIGYQKLHYKLLRDVLLDVTTPTAHHRWLDVGSAGSPTAFSDFEFTTVEPDPRVVALGRKLFHPDRIVCGILDTFETERRFDGVVFHNSLYCLPDPNTAFARVRDLVREGGLLIVCISSYFTDCGGTFADDSLHRIEDVFRGDVMWHYYTGDSLAHLAARHGFVAVSNRLERPEYPHASPLRYYVFERRDVSVEAPPADILRDRHASLLGGLIANFESVTNATLDLIDRPDVAVLGSRNLLLDLWRARAPRHLKHHVDLQTPDMTDACRLGGVSFSPVSAVAEAVERGEVRHLVLASYRNLGHAAAVAARHLPIEGLRIYVPTRTSGIDRLFGLFDGAWQPIKGFAVKPARYRSIDPADLAYDWNGAAIDTLDG